MTLKFKISILFLSTNIFRLFQQAEVVSDVTKEPEKWATELC